MNVDDSTQMCLSQVATRQNSPTSLRLLQRTEVLREGEETDHLRANQGPFRMTSSISSFFFFFLSLVRRQNCFGCSGQLPGRGVGAPRGFEDNHDLGTVMCLGSNRALAMSPASTSLAGQGCFWKAVNIRYSGAPSKSAGDQAGHRTAPRTTIPDAGVAHCCHAHLSGATECGAIGCRGPRGLGSSWPRASRLLRPRCSRILGRESLTSDDP
jgi:hypothetical protein